MNRPGVRDVLRVAYGGVILAVAVGELYLCFREVFYWSDYGL